MVSVLVILPTQLGKKENECSSHLSQLPGSVLPYPRPDWLVASPWKLQLDVLQVNTNKQTNKIVDNGDWIRGGRGGGEGKRGEEGGKEGRGGRNQLL